MIRTSFSIADPAVRGIRVDKYICDYAGLFPRSRIKDRLEELTVNGRPAKLSRRVGYRDWIEVTYDAPPEPNYGPEPMDLDVIHEDDDVIVVDKPQGMVVHPAAGNRTGTLVQGLLHHCASLEDEFPDEPVRPGIVHRLDKDTSGVIIAAKNPQARDFLASQFRRKSARKKYYALVKGRILQSSGTIDTFIARDRRNRKRFEVTESRGKRSLTEYRVLRRGETWSFLAVAPVTGRTHQIRVHLQSIGHPVIGDAVYGRADPQFKGATLMLHAYSLSIKLPGDRLRRSFRAPLPERFRGVLSRTIDNAAPE